MGCDENASQNISAIKPNKDIIKQSIDSSMLKSTEPTATTMESGKKNRKPKKKSKVASAGPEQLSVNCAVIVPPTAPSYVEEKASQEKENVLLALQSFIKVMEAYKSKPAVVQPKATAPTPGSSRKRNRESVQGCATFVIPHEASSDIRAVSAPRVLFAEPESEPMTETACAPAADTLQNEVTATADVDESIQVSEEKESVQEFSLGHCSKLGMSPGTFLRNRPSTCSPVTDRFFEFTKETCSPGSICLCAPTSEDFQPVSIEMFNTIEAVWDQESMSKSVAPGDDCELEQSTKRARRSLEDHGLSPVTSKDVSVGSYKVLEDHVKFAITTEVCSRIVLNYQSNHLNLTLLFCIYRDEEKPTF